MGKKTVETPYEKNTEYKWMDIPQTADYQAFKNMPIETDPTLQPRFGRMRRDFTQTFNNPLGSYRTPEMQMQQMNAGLNEIGQQQGQAEQEAAFDRNRLELARGESLMNWSRPELTTPKKWGYETQQKQGSGLASSLIGAAATIGAAFI